MLSNRHMEVIRKIAQTISNKTCLGPDIQVLRFLFDFE